MFLYNIYLCHYYNHLCNDKSLANKNVHFFLKKYRHKKNTLFLANLTIMVTMVKKNVFFQDFFKIFKNGQK
jgi:hypothetical protein